MPALKQQTTRAAAAFRDTWAVEWLDERGDYGEECSVLRGGIGAQVVYVAHTEQGSLIRIISARRALDMRQKSTFVITQGDGTCIRLNPDGAEEAITVPPSKPTSDETVPTATRRDPEAQPITDAVLTRMQQVPHRKTLWWAWGLTPEELATQVMQRTGLMLGVLMLLVCVGNVSGPSEAQTPLPPDFDTVLRQQITHLYPAEIPEVPQPWFNRPDAAKIALGEALFFDPNLSRCGTLACASCHRPGHGFASPTQRVPGCDGVYGRRRVPTLYNVAYQGHYFWDGRAQSLEQQALLPVVTPTELGNVWDVVLMYLTTGRHLPTAREYPQARAFYAASFAAVFNGTITAVTVSHALAAYERTILTRDAAFDRWLAGDDAAMTPAQKRGAERFFGRANCAVCHPPPLFSDDKFHNIATPQAGFETPQLFPTNATIGAAAAAQGWPVPLDVDLGRQEVPPLQSSWSDLGAFKTPTLRNVALHGPYMHNGALATLAEVMRHYERLAAGERQPLVGKLAFYVRYRKAHFGARGGGAADDVEVMVAFLQALTGTQRAARPAGVQPPRAERAVD